MESSHMLILHPTPQQEQYSNPECDGHCSNYLSCKSQHSAGGICIGILVGKQPEGEISGSATAQIVIQIPPAECWDLHMVATLCVQPPTDARWHQAETVPLRA